MKEPKGRTKPKAGNGNASEFGAVTIHFNPGPDAEDRLRRLFTLLLNHVAREGEADPSEGLSADAPVNDGTEQESTASGAHAGDAL